MSVALPLRPPAHQVDRRAVRWWQLRDLITVVVLPVPQLLGLALGWPGWLAITAIATAVLGLAYVLAVPQLLYRIHRWEITDEAVYTLSGWLVREWRIAPISARADRRHPARTVAAAAEAGQRHRDDGVGQGPRHHPRPRRRARGPELARVLTATTQATPGDAT